VSQFAMPAEAGIQSNHWKDLSAVNGEEIAGTRPRAPTNSELK